MEANMSNYHVVNVKHFPIGDPPLEEERPLAKRQRMFRKLPQAYIGNSARRYTFIPFCLLLITSLILTIGYIIMSYKYQSIIDELDLEIGILFCFLLCIFDGSASLIGLKVLNNSIVSAGQLFLLHAIMFIAIVLHMFVLAYEFLPDTRPIHTTDVTGNKFPVEYWACRSKNDTIRNAQYELERAYVGFCDQVLKVGNIFWSTIVLFVLLFISWRMTLCKRPIPIHPEVNNSTQFREMQAIFRRGRLSSMYETWQKVNKQQKPYYAHYPPLGQQLGDENANLHFGNNAIRPASAISEDL